jgi:cyclopropane-fatty-acyl-phospholipid synthase
LKWWIIFFLIDLSNLKEINVMKINYKSITEETLALAGISINGNKPWDIRVSNDEFYRRAITEGELGVGESYMDNWWDVEKLDEFIFRILDARLDQKMQLKWSVLLRLVSARLYNMQSKRRAFIVGEKHYDLGNDLFQNMLDKRMNYSCAYWKNSQVLDEAQENKLELICQKIGLKPGIHVLDIGCGWSAFGKYATEKYDARVTGITVSNEQVVLGKILCDGLPVDIRLMDYRDLNEKYDRIVSVGMIEHVGYKNYRTFFEIASKCLKKDGLFLLHTIGTNTSEESLGLWSQKYIFPNGMLPSVAQLGKAIENLFILEDWHSFGQDYDKTLLAWYKNFDTGWEKIKDQYSERFYRMWKYYLLSSAGSFRTRKKSQLWQIVLSKNGVKGGYESIR